MVYEFTVIPRFTLQLVPKKRPRKLKRRKSNFILLILQSSMFLTRNLKKLYEFTVIPRFTLQLVPKEGLRKLKRRKLNFKLLILQV